MAGISIETTEAVAPAIDAISLLRRDHGIVRVLFEEFSDAQSLRRGPIARRICKMLNVHSQIEEEIFYPVVRAAMGIAEQVREAEVEHLRITELIAAVEVSGGEDPQSAATVQQLAEAVAAHVMQEEQSIFGPVGSSRLDLVALGSVLAERKRMLMDLIGLHDDDELPAQPETRIEAE
ncbi:MAG TPA: hemerythrin domain-containing protein [Steroidobacteraceae bacterium]|jgi:hemerythrin superfamily protein